MLNYADIKGSLVKQAQSLPVPMISVPVEWTESINWIREVLTSDRAMTIYSRAWTATKWTAKATWTVVLVMIGLTMLAIDAWNNREEIKESAIVNVNQAVSRIKKESAYYFLFLRHKGVFAFDAKVIAPVVALRDRAKSAAQLMIQGKKI